MISDLRYTASVFLFVLLHLGLNSQTISNYGFPETSAAPPQKSRSASIAGTWETGVLLGPTFYYGDLNVNKFLPDKSISFAGGLYATSQFTNVFGLRAQIVLGGLRGSKSWQDGKKPVTESFSAFCIDFTVNSVINFTNMFSPYRQGRKVFVNGLLGAGVFAWNSLLTADVNGVVSNPDQIAGFQAGFVLPVGLGLQYNFTERISAGAEFTVRTVFSDNVDQSQGGFRCDIENLLAFTFSYRFGNPRKDIGVKDYSYSYPVQYKPVPPPDIPAQPEKLPVPQASPNEIYDYAVQVCAFSKHNYSADWVKKHFRISLSVKKESENGLNRYIIGTFFRDVNEARELCDKLRRQGIRDAWVIAYLNGIRHHVVIY